MSDETWTVVVECPYCAAWIAFNERSTERVCGNIDCKRKVRVRAVRDQIDDELQLRQGHEPDEQVS